MGTEYKITIFKKEVVTQQADKKWGVLCHLYMNPGEYAQLSYEERQQWKADGDQYSKPVMDYLPRTESEIVVETKIYEQLVDALDMTAVIKAVNEPVVKPYQLIPADLKS